MVNSSSSFWQCHECTFAENPEIHLVCSSCGIRRPPYRDKDILFGRGGGINNHEGNRRYLDLIGENRLHYCFFLKTNEEKGLLCDGIRNKLCREGRRFMIEKKTEPGVWEEASTEKIKEKIRKSLCDKKSKPLDPPVEILEDEMSAFGGESGSLTIASQEHGEIPQQGAHSGSKENTVEAGQVGMEWRVAQEDECIQGNNSEMEEDFSTMSFQELMNDIHERLQDDEIYKLLEEGRSADEDFFSDRMEDIGDPVRDDISMKIDEFSISSGGSGSVSGHLGICYEEVNPRHQDGRSADEDFSSVILDDNPRHQPIALQRFTEPAVPSQFAALWIASRSAGGRSVPRRSTACELHSITCGISSNPRHQPIAPEQFTEPAVPSQLAALWIASRSAGGRSVPRRSTAYENKSITCGISSNGEIVGGPVLVSRLYEREGVQAEHPESANSATRNQQKTATMYLVLGLFIVGLGVGCATAVILLRGIRRS